jgi:hypothetical protein
MVKGLSVTAVAVAMLVSTTGALATLQLQGFGIESGNAVAIIGDGAAANTNLLTLGVSQLATDDVRHTTAFQGFNGTLTQAAGAVGANSGLFSALQEGWLTGTQGQDATTGVQAQNISSGLAQNASQIGGNGSVVAIESLVGIGTQLTFTPYGASANIQAVGDTLYNGVGGGPSGGVTIGGGSTITAGQTSLW